MNKTLKIFFTFNFVYVACLRTLCREVFDEPIYFDDDKNGSVIGYEFRVKDIEARGQQRSYSLIVIMKDRIHLQQLWSFLQHHVHVIATNIKTSAQKVFDLELILNKDNFQNFYPSTSNKSQKVSTRGLIHLTNDMLIFGIHRILIEK